MSNDITNIQSALSSGLSAGLSRAGTDAGAMLLSARSERFTGVDIGKLADAVINTAQSGAENAGQILGQLNSQLSPVNQGALLRQLEQVPVFASLAGAAHSAGTQAIGLWNPVDDLSKLGRKIGELGQDAVHWLQRKAHDVENRLKSLPNDAANALADSMRGPNARTLTAGETAILRNTFGNQIDLSNVRIVNGPGYNPDAKLAFDVGGNPAITEGNTVYIRSDVYSADFSTSAAGAETLAHEFTHVLQFQQRGFGNFFAKYASDLVRNGGRNEVYRYENRPNTTYNTETLEGQAAMVGDYARYLKDNTTALPTSAQDLEARMRGTGLFGL
jgi:hypothetical protein